MCLYMIGLWVTSTMDYIIETLQYVIALYDVHALQVTNQVKLVVIEFANRIAVSTSPFLGEVIAIVFVDWVNIIYTTASYIVFMALIMIAIVPLSVLELIYNFTVYYKIMFTIISSSALFIKGLVFALGMGKCYVAEYMLLFWLFFLVSALVSFLFYLFIGIRGFIVMNIIGVLPFWLLSTYLFNWFVICENSVTFLIGEFNVMSIEGKQPFRLSMNKLTFGFGYLTLTISVFVLLYSFFYFRGEPTIERLPLMLMLFVNSMLLLLFSDNLLVTFIGWELIGVTSFFLINYWSTRVDTLKSALKALVFNLFSDAFFFLALLLIAEIFKTLDIPVLNSLSHSSYDTTVSVGHIKLSGLSVISVSLLIAASIKSAQFILHAWLPDSMEAPAPASALIHSATLVSAGIFLLIRLNGLWSGVCLPIPGFVAPIKDIIIMWGAITAAYGGLVSSKQTDLKRILAYSTISHCGYMMVLVGCGCINSLLFYFYIHGLFKALLFLITGNIMRHYQTQDFRKMGNAWSVLPFETAICIFSFAHLSGAPFSLGYVAKHSVLTLSPHSGIYGTTVVMLLIIGACSSVFYSIEYIRCVFFEPIKSTKSISQANIDHNQFSKFNNPTGNIGLLVLGVYYVYASALGYYLSIYLIDFSTLNLSLNPYDYTTNIANSKTLPIYGYSVLSIPVLTCYAVLISFFFYISRSNKVELCGPQLLVWLIPCLLFLHMYVAVYNISVSPINILDSLLSIFINNNYSIAFVDYIKAIILYITDNTISSSSLVTISWLNDYLIFDFISF